MSWRLIWSAGAERSLRQMPWRDAERVDAAIIAYAARGRGHVRRLPDDDAATLRLYVGMYRVRLSLDIFEGTMTVWMIYRPER